MRATDADGDTLTYSLTDASGLFRIDPISGQLSTAAPLPRRPPLQASFVVSAADPSGRVAVAQVLVTYVGACSDMTVPEFEESSYTFTISCPRTAGQLVGIVRASDSSPLRYTVSDSENFAIDNMGLLRTTRPITDAAQMIVVSASDGINSRSVNIQLIVPRCSGASGNDHVPEFEASSFEFSVNCNARIGTRVGMIWATDRDPGQAGMLSYTLSPAGEFTMSADGSVHTAARLASGGTRFLSVRAQDRGEPSRSAMTSLSISVNGTCSRVGALPPQCPTEVSASVERLAQGQRVAEVKATDADSVQLTYG